MLTDSHSADPMAEFPVSEVERQRRRYRRTRTTRSLLISAISTLIIAALIVVILASSPGWKTTQQTFFNWEYAKSSFPAVLSGMWLNRTYLGRTGILPNPIPCCRIHGHLPRCALHCGPVHHRFRNSRFEPVQAHRCHAAGNHRPGHHLHLLCFRGAPRRPRVHSPLAALCSTFSGPNPRTDHASHHRAAGSS